MVGNRSNAAMIAAISVALLAGCAADDPENPPVRGQWEHTITLDSVSVDGMLFGAQDVPVQLRQMEGTEKQCGEPLYRDPDWQARDVSERTSGQCTIDSFSAGTDRAEFTGSCVIENDGVRYTPAMRGRSTFSAEATRDVITLEGSFSVPGDSNPHVLKLIAVQEGKRTGDC